MIFPSLLTLIHMHTHTHTHTLKCLCNNASYDLLQFTDEAREEQWNLSKFEFWPGGIVLMWHTEYSD